MRRVFSYFVDIAFLGAPWVALLGMVGLEALAGTMFTSAGTIALLIVDLVLFVKHGRTLGMAATGLFAVNGRRWIALVVNPLLFAITLLVAYWIGRVLPEADVLSSDTGSVFALLIPPVALVVNLVFLVGSQRRTLTDFISGLHVVRAPALPALKGGLRPGLNFIDWLIAACIGMPVLLVLGHPPSPGAAIASLAGLLALGALELVLWKKTGATLGMRAVARQNLTEAAGFDPSASPPTRPQ